MKETLITFLKEHSGGLKIIGFVVLLGGALFVFNKIKESNFKKQKTRYEERIEQLNEKSEVLMDSLLVSSERLKRVVKIREQLLDSLNIAKHEYDSLTNKHKQDIIAIGNFNNSELKDFFSNFKPE